MREITRRGLLLGSASLGLASYARPARATLLRGLPLPALVQRSHRIAVLEPFAARCAWAEIGGRRSLVTDTRVRVHEAWIETGDNATEFVVRTLGGQLDGVGELVHGQPELELGVRGLGFLQRGRQAGVWWAVGMAQGHFPLEGSSDAARLLANKQLSTLLNLEASAVRRLVGRQLREARELVRAARPQ